MAGVSDPAVLAEPGFCRLVFVALGTQERRGGSRLNLPTKIWWLLMNDEGDAIVNAGRLLDPCLDDDSNHNLFERLPNVVSRRDGKISLVLPHTARDREFMATTIDHARNRPAIVAAARCGRGRTHAAGQTPSLRADDHFRQGRVRVRDRPFWSDCGASDPTVIGIAPRSRSRTAMSTIRRLIATSCRLAGRCVMLGE